MIYLPELHYFFDQKDFPFEKAVLVTAKKVSESCGHYKAKLISPLKGVKETERKGNLPPTTEEKHKFIENLVKWIFSNSVTQDLFALFLDDEEIGQRKEKLAKFDHHDDSCCWVMNLTEQQFQDLKNTWKNNGLPEDLFYPEGKEIKIIKPPGVIARFFIKPGFTFENSKIYSPKRWEEEKRKEFAAKEKLEIVLSAPVQGEAGGRGVWGEFRPPTCPPKFQRRRGPASSVRIFSNRHRQLGNELVLISRLSLQIILDLVWYRNCHKQIHQQPLFF